jgi:ABC-type uncharacterized transport system permease subunit
MSGLLVLGLPFVVFVSLARLSPGRQAVVGMAVAAVLAALFAAATGDDALALPAGAGIALALLAQGVRALMGDRLSRLSSLALLPFPYIVALPIVQRFPGA